MFLYACEQGSDDIFNYLLNHFQTSNWNFSYREPIENACTSGHYSIVKKLLPFLEKKDGEMAFFKAFRNGHLHIFKLLVDQGQGYNIEFYDFLNIEELYPHIIEYAISKNLTPYNELLYDWILKKIYVLKL